MWDCYHNNFSRSCSPKLLITSIIVIAIALLHTPWPAPWLGLARSPPYPNHGSNLASSSHSYPKLATGTSSVGLHSDHNAESSAWLDEWTWDEWTSTTPLISKYNNCVTSCLTLFRKSVIVPHSLLWRHLVLLTVGVYSSKHRVLYTIGISMTRRFQKSVGPSVRLSVCL